MPTHQSVPAPRPPADQPDLNLPVTGIRPAGKAGMIRAVAANAIPTQGYRKLGGER